MTWQIIDTGKALPQENMEFDRTMLEELAPDSKPILHLYDWIGDSATFGHFIRPETLLQMAGVAARGLQLARRPTGGGIIFHVADFAFSALVPMSYSGFSLNPLENYALINEVVAAAVKRFSGNTFEAELLPEEPLAYTRHCRHFCMAKPTKYDVMINGLKVGGAAQRRTRAGFLHQGSIALSLPDEGYLRDVLLPDTGVLEAMHLHSCLLLGSSPTAAQLVAARSAIKALLIEEIQQ